MAKKPGLMDRIDNAVELARREIKKGTRVARNKAHDAQVTVERKTKAIRAELKSTTAKAERNVKRQVKTVATSVKKAATKVEKAVSPKKPAARKAATPGVQLDKGIASVKRATKKAESAVREAVKPARKPAKKKTVKRVSAKK